MTTPTSYSALFFAFFCAECTVGAVSQYEKIVELVDDYTEMLLICSTYPGKMSRRIRKENYIL
jgi:hypothetical protein